MDKLASKPDSPGHRRNTASAHQTDRSRHYRTRLERRVAIQKIRSLDPLGASAQVFTCSSLAPTDRWSRFPGEGMGGATSHLWQGRTGGNA